MSNGRGSKELYFNLLGATCFRRQGGGEQQGSLKSGFYQPPLKPEGVGIQLQNTDLFSEILRAKL